MSYGSNECMLERNKPAKYMHFKAKTIGKIYGMYVMIYVMIQMIAALKRAPGVFTSQQYLYFVVKLGIEK